MGLGVHAGEWSALPCGSAAPPAERDCPLAKGGNNTHTMMSFFIRVLADRETQNRPGFGRSLDA
jgi:hypothetical protein